MIVVLVHNIKEYYKDYKLINMAASVSSTVSSIDFGWKFSGKTTDFGKAKRILEMDLANNKLGRMIKSTTKPPLQADYTSKLKFDKATEDFEDARDKAYSTLYARVQEDSLFYAVIQPSIDSKDPVLFWDLFKSLVSSKTLANALEIVTEEMRYIQESKTKFVTPAVFMMHLSMSRRKLVDLCAKEDGLADTPEIIAEKEALASKLYEGLKPYAIMMLNSHQFNIVNQFVNTDIHIAIDLRDVDFTALRAKFDAYLGTNKLVREYTDRPPTEEQAQPKRQKVDSDPATIKAMVASAVQQQLKHYKDRKSGGGKGKSNPPAQQHKPQLKLIPVGDRCGICVENFLKKNPGTAAKDARVNHTRDQCKRKSDDAPSPSANMATVAHPKETLPDGVAAFMADTDGNSTLHKFYIDSGANTVIINKYYRHLMYEVQVPLPETSTSIEGIDGETGLTFENVGKIRFMGEEIRCIYVPNISKSVLSVSALCSTRRFKFVFDDDYVIVINKNTKIVYKAKYSHELLYELNTTLHQLFEQVVATVAMLASVRPINQFDLWHARLGHVHEEMIRYMSKDKLYQERGLKISDNSFISKEKDLCSTCAIAKPTRTHSHRCHKRHPVKGRLWYMDVSGPFVIESLIYKSRYIIIFVDSTSRMIFDYYSVNVDSESMLSIMKQFNDEVLSSVVLDGDIIFIQSDNGQMKSDNVIAYLRRGNIFQRFTYPYHASMNPLAERSFRSIKEMARCQLHHAGLPDPYWQFSCSYAVFILNRLPNQTPDGIVRDAYFMWTTLTFDYSLLRTFGARAYAMNQITANDFGARAEEGIFVGFDRSLVSIIRMVYLPSKNVCVPAGDGQMSEHVGRPQPERILPLISETDREYKLEDYLYLKDTLHRDPHEGVNYKVIKVYIHKGFIVVDRVLYDISNPSLKRKTYDTVHARDVATYPIIDDRGEPLYVFANNIFGHIPLIDTSNNNGTTVSRDASEIGNTQPSLVSSAKDNSVSSEGDDSMQSGGRTLLPQVQSESNVKTKIQKRSFEGADRTHLDRKSKRKETSTALLAEVDNDLSWGRTIFDAVEDWLCTPPPHVLLADAEYTRETEPLSHNQAMVSSSKDKWIVAELAEIQSLNKLNFADIVDESSVPKGHPILPCKWVYKIKFRELLDELYKARLVIRGDFQKEGIDYGETFSPVAKLESIRLLIALTILWGLKPLQADVPSAFVQAPLQEEVYMRSIPGHPLPAGKVYKLLMSLYGLKQASRNWNKLFVATIQELDLIQLREDNCLFILRGEHGEIVILAIYVDDIYLATSNDELETLILNHLKKVFGITILGLPRKFLGLTLDWEQDADVPVGARYFSSCKISIPTAIDKLVKLLEIDRATYRDVPANPDVRLSKLDCPTEEQLTPETLQMQKLYRFVAGSGIWINTTCRPDITFAVTALCKFMSNPGHVHFQAAIWLVRYLSGTRNWGIKYKRNGNMHIEGYADSDFSGDESRHSIFSYLFMLAGAPISWKTGFQNRIALSTCEAEIRAVHAMKEAIKQIMWYNKVCSEIGLPLAPLNERQVTTLHVHEDNQAAIAFSRNPVRHSTMKHLERELYWIQEAVERKELVLVDTPSALQWADIGTKPCGHIVHHNIRSNIMHP